MKPILFNTEMVRAILNGKKTVTRRLVKPAHLKVLESPYHIEHPEVQEKALIEKLCQPPYQPGDTLYVRETWNRGYIDSSDAELSNEYWFEEYHKRDGSYLDGISGYVYRADFTRAAEYELGTLDENDTLRPMPWRPSIHMPKEAARIFLRVTDVRVERLQEIEEAGAQAEGLCVGWSSTPKSSKSCSARQAFMWLWDSTIKPADLDRFGWGVNPWVWVIEFERCEKPKEANNG